MKKKFLKNKPLVEAVFELRWMLKELAHGIKVDPHYKMLIGSIYDRVKNEYSFHEQLPTATMPDEFSNYFVQHRFRKGNEAWPLIQIGPGIITLNDTEGYIWKDFEKRISYLLNVLFDAYPNAKNNLKISGLLLRYIDAINFDYKKNNIFVFLKEKMKMNIEIHKELFKDTGVSKTPLEFDLKFSFRPIRTKGVIHLRFVRGKKSDQDALIWETQIQSLENDSPHTQNEIMTWIKEAHEIIDDWFFKMIEGELIRRFE